MINYVYFELLVTSDGNYYRHRGLETTKCKNLHFFVHRFASKFFEDSRREGKTWCTDYSVIIVEKIQSLSKEDYDIMSKYFYNRVDTIKQDSNLGARHNQGKPQWSLVDFKSLEPMVRVLEFGATKYSAYNWSKGLKTNEICESMLRHIFAYLNGEDNDPESGISHIGHIQCNAMFLSYMMNNKPELDTRYKKE